MTIFIVTSVDAEANAIGSLEGVKVIVGGIGRTNAAAATTEAILRHRGSITAIISAGVAGALPESNLAPGDCLVASACIYHEEGIICPSGFANMASLGFSLGDFEGNLVPVDEDLLEALSAAFAIGPIATVATCSGSAAAAAEVQRRTGALAEAMEGAAVVHAARRLRVPAIELRAISNTTGDRAQQMWDLKRGLDALGVAIRSAIRTLGKQ